MKISGALRKLAVLAFVSSIFLFTCHYTGNTHPTGSDRSIDISNISGRSEYPRVQISKDQKVFRVIWGKMSSNTGHYDPGSITVLVYDLANQSSTVSHPDFMETYSQDWLTCTPRLSSQNSLGLRRTLFSIPFPTWAFAGASGFGLKPTIYTGHTGIGLTRFSDGQGHSRTLTWQVVIGDDADPHYLAEGLLVDEKGQFAVFMAPEADRIFLYDLRGLEE